MLEHHLASAWACCPCRASSCPASPGRACPCPCRASWASCRAALACRQAAWACRWVCLAACLAAGSVHLSHPWQAHCCRRPPGRQRRAQQRPQARPAHSTRIRVCLTQVQAGLPKNRKRPCEACVAVGCHRTADRCIPPRCRVACALPSSRIRLRITALSTSSQELATAVAAGTKTYPGQGR